MSSTPFRLALIGFTPETVSLVQFAATSADYELVSAHDVGRAGPDVRRISPWTDVDDNWEGLLPGTACDAVIFAGGPDAARREEQLRKLVQAAVPLLVVHPACQMVFGFELLMIQRDTRAVMVPFFPELYHPAYLALHGLAGTGTDSVPPSARSLGDELDLGGLLRSLGNLQTCVIERVGPTADRTEVLNGFARDLLFASTGGDPVRRISALGPPDTEAPLPQLSVQMATETGTTLQWNYRHVPGCEPGVDWKWIGDQGEYRLHCPPDWEAWTLESAGARRALPGTTAQSARAALARLRQAVAGAAVEPTWQQACRALELQDAIHHSCRRGKTIDLHLEEVSEEKTFKAMMAAGGCLLLLLLLLALPFIGAAQAVLLPDATAEMWQQPPFSWFAPRRWPVYLAAVLVAFLALQLLRLVFHSDAERDAPTP